MPITMIIVDDHPLTCSGLAKWINRNKRFKLLADVDNGREAWAVIQR